MIFQDFLDNGKVRKGNPDISLSKSMVNMSLNHSKTAKSIKLDDTTCSTVFTLYYEALREICEAICSLEGYKVYSHEAFTYFLKDYLNEEHISNKFDRLRLNRNRINYYGKTVSLNESKSMIKTAVEIIKLLKEKYIIGKLQ